MTPNRFRTTTISIVFILLISFPYINKSFRIVKDLESSENRALTEKPELNINRLDGFPTKYDEYYSDNFSLRHILIKYYNLLNLLVYKKSPVPKVIIGHDGWFFFKGNEDNSYRGSDPLTIDEMEQIRLEMEYRKQYLDKIGIKLYLAIAPAKVNVYPEKMPLNAYRKKVPSWCEQLNDYLIERSDINVVNLHKALWSAKSNGLVYYKADTHWNEKGAFFAANEVLSIMNKDFPAVKPLAFSDMVIKDTLVRRGNIIDMLANLSLFQDSSFIITPKDGFESSAVKKVGYPITPGFPYGWEYEMEREIPESQLPKLLIISDSFGGHIFPFLAENFGRTVKIFDAWQFKLNEEIVANEKPDAILVLLLESNIRNILEHQSRLNNKPELADNK